MFNKVKEMSQITAKRTAEDAKLTAEDVTEKKAKATKKPGPWMPIEFDTNGNPVEIGTKKGRGGEVMPVVKVKGRQDNMAAQFNTPCLTVHFNDLGPKGNIKSEYATETNYAYVVKSITGLPDKVSAAMPKEEGRQQAFFSWVDQVCDQLLETAFETPGCMESFKKKAARAAKKNKTDAKTEFVNGANKAMFKEWTDSETDEDYNFFVCKRRGLTMVSDSDEKVDNRPVFWKRTREGFEKMDVPYITQGTVLKYQIGFRCYTTGGEYGVSCQLGKNIVVIYQKNAPKPKNTENQTSNEPSVPFIEF